MPLVEGCTTSPVLGVSGVTGERRILISSRPQKNMSYTQRNNILTPYLVLTMRVFLFCDPPQFLSLSSWAISILGLFLEPSGLTPIRFQAPRASPTSPLATPCPHLAIPMEARHEMYGAYTKAHSRYMPTGIPTDFAHLLQEAVFLPLPSCCHPSHNGTQLSAPCL